MNFGLRISDWECCLIETFNGGKVAAMVKKRNPKSETRSSKSLVAVIMGSKSDWETMRHTDEMLTTIRCAA